MSGCKGSIGFGVAVFETLRLAEAVTVIGIEAVLSPGLGSTVGLEAVAAFDASRGATADPTVAVMVIVARPSAGSAPTAHVTGVPSVHVPLSDVALVAVTPGGSGSDTVTSAASDGPTLVTVTV